MKEVINVPFEFHADAMPAMCIDNVEKMVAKHGGSVVLGWDVEHACNLFDTHHHHAIWRKPSGAWVEITPRQHIGGYAYMSDCEFIRDDAATFNVGKFGRVRRPNIFVPLVKHKLIERACDALARSDDHYARNDFDKGDYWTDKANGYLFQYAMTTGRGKPVVVMHDTRNHRYGDPSYFERPEKAA